MPTLSEILKSKIGKDGLSKTYVANELNVTERTIENYMSGDREPKPSRLVLLSKMLGFSLDDISENDEQNVPRETDNVLNEPTTYLEKRLKQKNGTEKKGVPVYFGNTRAGNIEVYSDDPEMQNPVGFFDPTLFPGCNHAEKVNGDSMHPIIRNQAIVAGKVIDKRGIIFGEKYGIHTRYGMPTAKFIQESDKGPEYLKLISYNESVKPFDIKFDDISFIFWIKYIVNPA